MKKLDEAMCEEEYRAVGRGLTEVCGMRSGEKYAYEWHGEQRKVVHQIDKIRGLTPGKILEIYKELGTWKKTAEFLGVSEQVVSRYKKENEKFLSENIGKDAAWKQLDKDKRIIKRIYKMRVIENATVKRIAAHIGTSEYKINQIIKNGENYARIAGKKR
ncbi:MAG TPA: hypothetical protein VIH12_06710 [Solibacillus sp.]